MATLTRNLFWGQGERVHRLDVIDGHWPTDMEGAVFVVGPDKRRPGGHWFGAHGLVQKIHCRPGPDGRILVEHRLVDTPVKRMRDRLPILFRQIAFMEVSPLGITNFANTNVQPIGDRMFIGYDAGRPVEIDPETLDFVTFVGANDEWLQSGPGALEPLCAVAAHPAPDFEEQRLYFVNYDQITPPGESGETHLARWDLHGSLERWRLSGMSPFDSIHDVKVTRDHVVFSDLPFKVEPDTFRGRPRRQRNQDHTLLWIVAKADLEATETGGTVPVTEVRIPMPTGHLSVDYEEPGGRLRVFCQHIPLADLMIAMSRDEHDHRNGQLVDPNYEGLIPFGVQPGCVGRYLVDPGSGEVLETDLAHDLDRFWGPVLGSQDTFRPEARARQRRLHFVGTGYDPDLVPETWWRLYGDADDGLVAPGELPDTVRPGALATFDLEAMKVSQLLEYEGGAFPHPPTFVPRVGSDQPDDGYVVVVVHQDGPKELQVFDADDVERGPLARAWAPDFNPPLMLHSQWMWPRRGPRPSAYRVGLGRDLRGAARGLPGVVRGLARMGRAMQAQAVQANDD